MLSKYNVITLFPKLFDEWKNTGVISNGLNDKIFTLETKLFPCLVDMKFKGVKIDVEKAKRFGEKLEKRRDNLINIIKKRTGVDIQIWAAASIKKLLYNKDNDTTKRNKNKI